MFSLKLNCAARRYRAGRRGRLRFRWAVIAPVGIVACACSRGTEEARGIEAALDGMPGVHRVSTDFDSNFSTVVMLTGDASAEQSKAVIEVSVTE
ncbi:hypothetical protein [Nocardia sp. CS682]|uniref:hypothetical protein n=1 Tax=Nocardia sp. CS682 TaxID=1047172 RepID=UPI0010757E5D|nr:hypothetical protein [Nocardia sp. CS682]